MTTILIIALALAGLCLAYLLYAHADLKAQAQNLAQAVLIDARADAQRIARKIQGVK